MRIRIDRGITKLPSLVADLIEELYALCIEIARGQDIPIYYINRSWGTLGEGQSLASLRGDYERFLQVLEETLDSRRYFLQTETTDSLWPGPQARIRVHGTLMEDPVFQDLAVHQGIYINIYPIDGLAARQMTQSRQLKRYEELQQALHELSIDEADTWSRIMTKRQKLMTAFDPKKSSWLIIYPMEAGSVRDCILSPDELQAVGLQAVCRPTDYSEWTFDIPEDIDRDRDKRE